MSESNINCIILLKVKQVFFPVFDFLHGRNNLLYVNYLNVGYVNYLAED